MRYKAGSDVYEFEEGWAKLPEGHDLGRVAGAAVDEDDRVFIFNRGTHPLTVLGREGNFLKAWDEQFGNPHGITVGPDGNVYLADREHHVVLKYSPDGDLLMTLGNRDRPSDTGRAEEWLVERAAGPFNLPTWAAVGEKGGIFVSDGYGNSRVHKFTSTGDLVTSWGSPGKGRPGEFHLPHGIAIDPKGRVLVCDRENHRVQIFDRDGAYLGMWTDLRQPTSLGVSPDGLVFVAELQHRITVMDLDGRVVARWGGESSRDPGHFVAPHGVAFDSRGDVYVSEVLEGRRIQKFVKL